MDAFGHSRLPLGGSVAGCGSVREGDVCLQNIPGSSFPLSAIAVELSCLSPSNPKGDRVVVRLNGKFLPYTKW